MCCVYNHCEICEGIENSSFMEECMECGKEMCDNCSNVCVICNERFCTECIEDNGMCPECSETHNVWFNSNNEDNKLYINKDNPNLVTATLAPPEPKSIKFFGKENLEILRLENNGDIYVKGKLIENDKEVVDGLREFLSHNLRGF